MIFYKLYDEEKLKAIKQICEIATKEYAIQQALESLDRDIKAIEFDMQTNQDGETKILLKLPEVVSQFEEFHLRVSVLKTNPHMKNFYDKLVEIEKTIKLVIDIIGDWAIF